MNCVKCKNPITSLMEIKETMTKEEITLEQDRRIRTQLKHTERIEYQCPNCSWVMARNIDDAIHVLRS